MDAARDRRERRREGERGVIRSKHCTSKPSHVDSVSVATSVYITAAYHHTTTPYHLRNPTGREGSLTNN